MCIRDSPYISTILIEDLIEDEKMISNWLVLMKLFWTRKIIIVIKNCIKKCLVSKLKIFLPNIVEKYP